MSKITPTLFAVSDLLMPVKMFWVTDEAADTLADQASSLSFHNGPMRQYRPDIAEAIARGEYTFMQRNSRGAGFHRRTALLRFQRTYQR